MYCVGIPYRSKFIAAALVNITTISFTQSIDSNLTTL